jgi:hypothetical protein
VTLAGDGEQRRRSVNARLGRGHGGRPAAVAVISTVIGLAVDLGA